MRVASHQPAFLPWLGFWNKLLAVDVFIISAGVDFDYGGYGNRVRLCGGWLTVPVLAGTRSGPYDAVRFDRAALPRLAATVRNCFGVKRPQRERAWAVAETLDEAYRGSDFLLDLDLALLGRMAEILGVAPALAVDHTRPGPESSKTRRLMDRIRRHVPGPLSYFAGAGAAGYLDPAEIDPGVVVLVQSISPGTSGDSLLTTLATHADPVEAIRAAATWTPWGDLHA